MPPTGLLLMLPSIQIDRHINEITSYRVRERVHDIATASRVR